MQAGSSLEPCFVWDCAAEDCAPGNVENAQKNRSGWRNIWLHCEEGGGCRRLRAALFCGSMFVAGVGWVVFGMPITLGHGCLFRQLLQSLVRSIEPRYRRGPDFIPTEATGGGRARVPLLLRAHVE